MKTKYLLDANVLLRLLLDDNPDQVKQTLHLLSKAKVKKIQIIVPQIVVFEVEFILEKYYKIPKAEIVDKLRVILGVNYLKIDDRVIFQDASELFLKNNTSFADCFIFYLARHHHAKLFTFDQKLSKL